MRAKLGCPNDEVVYAAVMPWQATATAEAAGELPRRFVVHNRHEHIQAAAVRAVAAKGYRATQVRDICAAAHISSASFHKHFSDKEQAVLSGIEAGVDQVMAICQEIHRTSPTWPDAVWNSFQAYADWACAEPEFTRAKIVELLDMGPSALDLLHSLIDAFAMFLAPGYELLEPSAKGRLDEPVTQRVFELMYVHVVQHSPQTLCTIVPQLTRTALMPFLGPSTTDEFIAWRETGLQASPTLRDSA